MDLNDDTSMPEAPELEAKPLKTRQFVKGGHAIIAVRTSSQSTFSDLGGKLF